VSVRLRRVGPDYVRKIGPCEVGARKLGVREVCPIEVGEVKICTCERGSIEICTVEIGSGEVGVLEIGLNQFGCGLNLVTVPFYSLTLPRHRTLESNVSEIHAWLWWLGGSSISATLPPT